MPGGRGSDHGGARPASLGLGELRARACLDGDRSPGGRAPLSWPAARSRTSVRFSARSSTAPGRVSAWPWPRPATRSCTSALSSRSRRPRRPSGWSQTRSTRWSASSGPCPASRSWAPRVGGSRTTERLIGLRRGRCQPPCRGTAVRYDRSSGRADRDRFSGARPRRGRARGRGAGPARAWTRAATATCEACGAAIGDDRLAADASRHGAAREHASPQAPGARGRDLKDWRGSVSSPRHASAPARARPASRASPSARYWTRPSTGYGPGFAAVSAASAIWVNGEPPGATTPVGDSDEVAVLPPVSGG